MSIHNFTHRHVGPRVKELEYMLSKTGDASLDDLIDKTIPSSIRLHGGLDISPGMSENEYLRYIWQIASCNEVYRTYIGMGYYNTYSPSPIVRDILENPSWYTSYTPYQAEISQGRLEALLNYQTMVTELTGLPIANASLLDEATAAAEAMVMFFNNRDRDQVKSGAKVFFVDQSVFPQTLAVLQTRANPLGIEVREGDYAIFKPGKEFFGALVQYPDADGCVRDYKDFAAQCRDANLQLVVSVDLLSLVMLVPPGQWGADVVVGTSQRFGISMGYGGPHAAFFAAREDYKRAMPGRIIGVSVDARGERALRMALQTREQHIKRERATSNICTAQALLASMAGMYAVYHGPEGLKEIASGIHAHTILLNQGLSELGYFQENKVFFDTLKVKIDTSTRVEKIRELSLAKRINLRYFESLHVGISLDETVRDTDVQDLVEVFAEAMGVGIPGTGSPVAKNIIPPGLTRTDNFLGQDVFNSYHSETELTRYIKRLERKDFSLTHSMIPLGSCTMKLNPATAMFALSWPEFAHIHPFVPVNQAKGYHILFEELTRILAEITGLPHVSLQPNSGASGEYAGLLVIRSYHESRGEAHRDVVLIPASAHGTNPASAVMAGLKVVVVPCDDRGNIKIEEFKRLALEHEDRLCACMITYPSTHGVFEEGVRAVTGIVHDRGGLVYMDGANMNAQVGLTSPGSIGADVCHLNLHKTFAIPHGGGGPGVGPIAVTRTLAEFLPRHPVVSTGGERGVLAVSAAPYGSASILTISHAYCKLLGGEGLKYASMIAILNANYLAACLEPYFPVLYKGDNQKVAHEMILDCRPFREMGITESDIAKRLMDYGFHAPTLSFPVHGTLMIEPTESESLQELDRFVESMIEIYNEIMEIREGKTSSTNNLLKNAPHAQLAVVSSVWDRPYSREKAAFPLPWIAENKFWPAVSRVDDAYGDRNLVCTCQSTGNF